MSVTFDYDSFLLEDQLFGSSGALYSVKTTEVLMDSQSFLSSSMDDSLKFDVNNMLPTPPVSPSRDSDCNKETDDDLDLGLDLLGIDIPGFLTGSDADSQWLFDELFKENGLANANEQDSLLLDSQVRRSEVGELRHDCMWAGTCHEEQEHHRLKKELMLLSTSPNEPLMAAALQQEVVNEEVKVTRIERRTRLDTLGSLRPETPSSLSDSELEAEHLTADSSDDAAVKDEMNSESSSDEESEDEDDKVPANIQPVRNTQQRKNVLANVKCSLKSAVVNSLPDHSYSHSDHSYHTQRRPQNDNLLADQLGIQTPSDSEEEIDVVSLGEVLGVSTNASMISSGKASMVHVAAGQTSAAHAAPLRLKLKVSPAGALNGTPQATTVLMRKTLPSYPSPLDRQQLQLAVATAAQQKKQLDIQPPRKAEFQTVVKTVKNPAGVCGTKRPRTESPGSSSPRKRSSRNGSDSEDSTEKRSQHNSMERQRRVDLRNAFEFLRSLIPDLEATDRAAKVVILKKSAHFCQGLTAREKKLIDEKNALQKSQEMLRKRLALLQQRKR